MARRNPNVSVNIDLEADASSARKDIAKDLGKIEDDAKDTVKGIERAFENLSPELDTSEIRQALALAGQLDGMVAEFTVDTDLEEIKQAEQIARSLRSFQGRVDLSVEGRAELRDALDLAEKMDQIRKVKVDVQGRQDLERAAHLAEDLEQRRTVKVDVDTRELKSAEADIRDMPAEIPLHVDGSAIGDEVEGAFDDIDVNNIADDLGGRLTGALAGAGAIGSGLALAAEAWGDDLMEGFGRGFNSKKIGLQEQIETGFSEADLRPIGKAAGDAYAEGFGEGLHELTLAAATLEASLRSADEGFDLKRAVESATVLEDHLGVGIPESAVLAARMIRTELADDTVEAMDIMTYATQNFGDVGVQALEVMGEFAPVFGRMKIDGAAAVDFVARSFAEGLVPTIDRGAELLEEFQIRITDLDSQDAIKQLGVDFQVVSDLLARGEGAKALEMVTAALLNMKDKSQQATLANIIFGAAMESAFDRPELIARLHNLATEQLNVAGASEKATENAKAMQTEWDKSGRVVEQLGSKVGVVALGAFNDLAGAIEQVTDGYGAWGDASDNVSGKLEGFGDLIQVGLLGPLGSLADDLIRIGGELGKHVPFWQSWWGEAEKAAEITGVVGNEVAQAEGAMALFNDRISSETQLLGASQAALDEATAATEQLDAALQAFSARFDGDRVMRKLEEDAKAATAATEGLTAKNYDLTNGFDITTEKGRAAAAALEDLSLDTAQLADAFVHSNATAADLASGQQRVTDTLRAVAAQMGLNEQETNNLIARYGAVQDEIITNALFQSENALAAVLAYQRELGRIPSQKTTTVATHFVTTGSRVFQTGGGFAEGGDVKGGVPIVVGEKGTELFVPDQDGTIIPDGETKAILNGNPRARAMATAGAGGGAGGGGGRAVVEIRSSGSDVDNFLVQLLRKAVRNRGGIDVVFA